MQDLILTCNGQTCRQFGCRDLSWCRTLPTTLFPVLSIAIRLCHVTPEKQNIASMSCQWLYETCQRHLWSLNINSRDSCIAVCSFILFLPRKSILRMKMSRLSGGIRRNENYPAYYAGTGFLPISVSRRTCPRPPWHKLAPAVKTPAWPRFWREMADNRRGSTARTNSVPFHSWWYWCQSLSEQLEFLRRRLYRWANRLGFVGITAAKSRVSQDSRFPGFSDFSWDSWKLFSWVWIWRFWHEEAVVVVASKNCRRRSTTSAEIPRIFRI